MHTVRSNRPTTIVPLSFSRPDRGHPRHPQRLRVLPRRPPIEEGPPLPPGGGASAAAHRAEAEGQDEVSIKTLWLKYSTTFPYV